MLIIRSMEKLTLVDTKDFRIECFAKDHTGASQGEKVESFKVTALAHHPLLVEASDEIPFFFYDANAHLIGAAKLTKDETLAEFLKAKMHEIIVQYNLLPKDILCYFGPSLTFSHTTVDRSVILKVMDLGYRAAAKRTSGVDFFDVPIMNFLMLRKLGVPAENIFIDAHDTFECDQLFYSKLRGDKLENPSVIEMLK